MLNILKVIEYDKTVAIEWEPVEPIVDGYQPHHPDTFTMTWDDLLLRLPVDSGHAECVVLAVLLLKLREDDKERFHGNTSSDLLTLAREAMGEEGSPSQ